MNKFRNNILDTPKKDDENPAENPVDVASKPIKGYKDFNQLQAEMRQREKDLKKKLKKQREKEKSTASSTNNDVINNNDVTDAKSDVIDGNNDEIDDDRTKPPSDRNSDSSDVENDLPDTYIEEIVTERQFIDSDGQVQTEVTTVEVNFDLFSLKIARNL